MENQATSNSIPAELKYATSHEWLRLEDDGTITVGITHHAQGLLGDVMFIELPEVGANLAAEEQAGVVESMKAASGVYALIAGEVVAVNEDLPSTSGTADSAPYGIGWFFKIKSASPADYDGLLTTEQYAGEVD